MARSGRRKGPRVAKPKPAGPIRTCIGSRVELPRGEMARLVCGPDGIILVDRHLKAPGRGAHLCYDAEAIRAAVKRRALSRAFKGQVITNLPDEDTLTQMLVDSIDERLEDTLRLARRARASLKGADLIQSALKRGEVKLVLVAEDAAEGTANRISNTARAVEVEAIIFGDRQWLGETQGGAPIAALGVLDEAFAERIKIELERRRRVLVAG